MRLSVSIFFACIVVACASPRAEPPETRVQSLRAVFPGLALFFEDLDANVRAGAIGSTEQVIERCRRFYTTERMAEIEAVLPGWRHMASFADGKTLWHVNVAMVALLQLDEYRSMSRSQRTVQERVVLLHDSPPQGKGHAEVLGPGLGVAS